MGSLAVLRIALVLSVTWAGSALLAQPAGPSAALPIQWRIIPPERAAMELEKVQQGVLILTPLADFEARLKRTRQAAQRTEKSPRLTRAHYQAELIDRSLARGQGSWTIDFPGETDSVLPIAPLSLALSGLRWDQGTPGILGEPDGQTLGLLVKPGHKVCRFDWSARGTPTNDGMAFQLLVPPCTINTFELDLPADVWLLLSKESALVTGPHDEGVPGKRKWRLQAVGASPIQFVVRKIVDGKGAPPTLFTHTHSEQHLMPDRLEVEHEFDISILHGSVRELNLIGDAALQPFDVVLKSGEVKNFTWTELPVKKTAKGKPAAPAQGRLTIRFHRPVQGKLTGLHISSLASKPASGMWTSPGLHVVGAIRRGETLALKLHPDLALGRWDHGTFQFTMSQMVKGMQSLTLADTAADVASTRRPGLVLFDKKADLHTRELVRWHLTPRGMRLEAEIACTTSRSNVFELRAKLPTVVPRYQIESLAMQPPDMLRDWRVEGGFLIVELGKPLAPLNSAVVKIEFRSNLPGMASGPRTLAFPEMDWLDAKTRQGAVEVFVDPILEARLLKSSLPVVPEDAGGKSSTLKPPSFRFRYCNQRLSANIRLVPRAVQVQFQGKHRITLMEQGALMRFRWEVKPLLGAPEHVDFQFAPGFPRSWKVIGEETAPVHHWERLFLNEALPHLMRLGCKNPWEAATLDSLLPEGECWRFHFSRPLQAKTTLALEAMAPPGLVDGDLHRLSVRLPSAFPWECVGSALVAPMLPVSPGDKTWLLPLMVPVQRENVRQEMVVDTTSAPIVAARKERRAWLNPVEIRPAAGLGPSQSIQFADGAIEPGSRILVSTRAEKNMISALERCDAARISTHVARDGVTFHRIEFRLWNWRERTCDLHLPAHLRVVSVSLNGQTLPRFDATPAGAQVRLALPYDQNEKSVRYEVLAKSKAQATFLPGMMRIETPVVVWPVAPQDPRARLFLEGHLTPLAHDVVAPVGEPYRLASQSPALRRVRQVWNWGQEWWPLGERARLRKALDEQKQNVLAAEKELRDKAEKPLKLSEALDRLAVMQLKDTVAVVIDPQAFRALGLAPETLLPRAMLGPQTARPFWEGLGLVYVPCPGGALLTSPDRLRRWGITDATDAEQLGQAVQEAVRQGRDPASDFCLVPVWAEFGNGDELIGSNDTPGLGMFDGFRGRTEWATLAVGAKTPSFLVVDPTSARTLGWALAFLAGFGFWRIHRACSVTSAFRVHLVLIAGGILVAVWLPGPASDFFAWPSNAVALGSLLWNVLRLFLERREKADRANSSIIRVVGAAAVAVAFFFGISWDVLGQPAAPRPNTVLVINGPKPAVLVSPELLAKLADLEARANPITQGTFLIGASYAGVIHDGFAKFDVDYEIYCLKEQAKLLIPLSGVQLQGDAFLDGAPVFPVPHRFGYALPIRKPGVHRLRLSFTARVAAASDLNELAFKIPKLPQTEFALEWKIPAKNVYCDKCLGEESLSLDSKQLSKSWRGRLGYVGAFNLRWAGPGAPTVGNSIEVQEAHFWDLRPGSVALFSALKYTLGKSALSRLSVTLPDGVSVRSVEATLTPPLVAPSAPILIKQWSILEKGAQRQLAVDFVQPVAGKISLHLEFVPRGFGKATQLLLSLPAPVQGKSVAGLLGYRLDVPEKDTPAAPNLGIIRILSAAEFQKQWSQSTRLPIPAASRGYAFERRGQQAGLRLEVVPIARQAQADLLWRVDSSCCEFTGAFTFRSAQEDLILAEFALDAALTLADVTGPDVYRWQRQDGLLQVWLRQAQRQTVITLKGWRNPAAKQPLGKVFALPGVYPLDTRLQDSTLEIRTAGDVEARVEKTRGLRASVGDRLGFAVIEPNHQVILRLVPRVRQPKGSMLTKVQGIEGGFDIHHAIRLRTRRGALPPLKLGVKHWVGDAPTLAAPGAAIQKFSDKTGSGWVWSLQFPPGQPEEVFLFLRGQISPANLPSMQLPVVSLQGAILEDSWIAWKNVELFQANQREKLLDQPALEASLPGSFAQWHPDRAQWKLARSIEAPMSVAFLKVAPRALVRILGASEEIRVAGGPPWLREAVLWFHAPDSAELRVKFPAALESISVFLDGRPYAAWTLDNREVTLKAGGQAEPRRLHLRWRYAGAAERADLPNLMPLTIDQARVTPHKRWLWVPPGSYLARTDAARRPTWFASLLQEADLHLQISKALAEATPRPAALSILLAHRQRLLNACVQHARYALALARLNPIGIDLEDWEKRIHDVERKNTTAAKALRFDTERQAALKLAAPRRAGFSIGEPEPLAEPWNLPQGMASAKLHLAAERVAASRRTWTEWVLLGMVTVLVLSYFRHGWPILRALAPELALGSIVAAMILFNWSLVGILLTTALLVLRGIGFARFVRRQTAGRAKGVASGGSDDTTSHPPEPSQR